MSHFTVLVLVANANNDAVMTEDELQSAAAALLEPYSENLEVPEYQRDCSCVGREAQNAATGAANAKIDLQELRAQYGKKFERAIAEQDAIAMLDIVTPQQRARHKELEKELQKQWQSMEFYGSYAALRDRLEAEHPMYKRPSADCEACHGSGQITSTYNPKSKWDWFQLGGRWNGHLTTFLKPGTRPLSNSNIIRMSDLDSSKPDLPFFAVLTPDGEWHAEAEMGWFGVTYAQNPSWEQELLNILRDNVGCYGLLYDCHI